MSHLTKKLLIVVAIIAVVAIGMLLTSTVLVVRFYEAVTTEKKTCAVVFGAAVWKDNIPSHALFDRTKTAVALYKNNQVDCLVLSGGPSRYGEHETEVMRQLVHEYYDIAEKNLVLDHDGINTLATIRNLDKSKTYIFVSNDFHLARIAIMAHTNGIKNFALMQATYHEGRYTKEPQFFLHEVIGILYYVTGLYHIIPND